MQILLGELSVLLQLFELTSGKEYGHDFLSLLRALCPAEQIDRLVDLLLIAIDLLLEIDSDP